MRRKPLTTRDRIVGAKVYLQDTHPFLAHLLMFMDIQEREGGARGTMAVTRGGKVYWDDEWMGALTNKQIRFVLLHEAGHVMNPHHFHRWKNVPDAVTAIAIDLKVNAMIVEDQENAKHLKPVDNGLIPEVSQSTGRVLWRMPAGGFSLKPGKAPLVLNDLTSLTVREVIDKILDVVEVSELPTLGFDAHEDDDSPGSAANGGELSEEWKERVAQAAAVARDRGKLPGSVARDLKDLLEPAVDWRDRLRNFVDRSMTTGHTWFKPKRKSWTLGTYYPAPVRENLDVVIHVDSSGSTWNMLEDFVSELKGVFTSFRNVEATVLVGDAELKAVHKLTGEDAEDLESVNFGLGGGGTSHRWLVDWVSENARDAKLLLSLTDGMSDIDQTYPDLPPNVARVLFLKGCPSPWLDRLEGHAEIVKVEDE